MELPPDNGGLRPEEKSGLEKLGLLDDELSRLRALLETRNFAAADRLTNALLRSGAESRALPMLGKVKFLMGQFPAAAELWSRALQDNLLVSLEMVHMHGGSDDFCLGQLKFKKKLILFNSNTRGDHSFALTAENLRPLMLGGGMAIRITGTVGRPGDRRELPGGRQDPPAAEGEVPRRFHQPTCAVGGLDEKKSAARRRAAWTARAPVLPWLASGRNTGRRCSWSWSPRPRCWRCSSGWPAGAGGTRSRISSPPPRPRLSTWSMTRIEGTPDSGERKPSPSPGIHGKIEVLVGGQQISTYLVTDNPLPIGRDPGQALVLIQEPIVSKLHCQIFARGGEVFVKDLNSTNGVYVNEEKIGERELQDGDVVFLGKKGSVRIIYHR